MSGTIFDVATEKELRELFSMGENEPLADRIPVCAGEWVKIGHGCWHFNADDELDEDLQ